MVEFGPREGTGIEDGIIKDGPVGDVGLGFDVGPK